MILQTPWGLETVSSKVFTQTTLDPLHPDLPCHTLFVQGQSPRLHCLDILWTFRPGKKACPSMSYDACLQGSTLQLDLRLSIQKPSTPLSFPDTVGTWLQNHLSIYPSNLSMKPPYTKGNIFNKLSQKGSAIISEGSYRLIKKSLEISLPYTVNSIIHRFQKRCQHLYNKIL
jgi:hypothetical protein